MSYIEWQRRNQKLDEVLLHPRRQGALLLLLLLHIRGYMKSRRIFGNFKDVSLSTAELKPEEAIEVSLVSITLSAC